MRINQINRRRSPPWHSNDNQNPRSDIASELLVFPMWFAPPMGPCGIWKWAYLKISLFFVFHWATIRLLWWSGLTELNGRSFADGDVLVTFGPMKFVVSISTSVFASYYEVHEVIWSPWINSVHPKITKFRFCLCSKIEIMKLSLSYKNIVPKSPI